MRKLYPLFSCLATAMFIVTGPIAAAKNIELVMWDNEREDEQKVLEELIAEFHKANPTIKVKSAHYKTEDLRTQFQTAAMAGKGADIVLAPNDFAGPFSLMGAIQPVNSWGKLERFNSAVLSAATDNSGKSWGLPITRGNHLMLFVNGNLVKAAPTTIEDMIKVAKANTDAAKGKYGLVYNLNEPFWFVTFLAASGSRPLVDRKPQLGGDAMVEALTLVHDLKFKEGVVPKDCDYACADALFNEGKSPMTINGDWTINDYRRKFGDKLIIAPLPKFAKTGKSMQPMISGKYLFFNKKLASDRLEAAKKLADYFTSRSVQEILTAKTQRLPSLNELASDKVITADPVLSAADAAMANGQPMPMDIEMRVVWDAIRPQLQEVMAGRIAPKVAAAAMQKDAETKIKELKK